MRHVDRLNSAAALAMSQEINATQAMEGEEPPSSERPALWGAASTPQARVAQWRKFANRKEAARLAGGALASAWQMVRSHMGYT